MTEARRRTLIFAMLLLGIILQIAVGSRLSMRLAVPNIALTSLGCACLFVDSGAASAFGFTVGLLEGSYTATLMGTFIVSRTITGFLIGLLEDRVFRDSIPLAIITVLIATFVSGVLFFSFAPQPQAGRWFAGLIFTAFYNALLALPLYAAMRKVVGRPRIA
jgi:rod shape-determining protein MreD